MGRDLGVDLILSPLPVLDPKAATALARIRELTLAIDALEREIKVRVQSPGQAAA